MPPWPAAGAYLAPRAAAPALYSLAVLSESSGPLLEFAPEPASARWRTTFAVIVTLVAAAASSTALLLVAVPSAIEYRVGGGSLTIAARHGAFPTARTIRLTDILAIEEATLREGRRTGGTSLPGFCAGHFTYPDIGSVWQATNCGREVLLLRVAGAEKPILVSPGDPHAFRATLAAGGPATFAPAAVGTPRGWWAIRLLAAAPAALVALLPWMLLVAPRRLGYGVGPGVIEVRTLWRRRRFDLSAARARSHAPSRSLKLIGSAMPGYYAGLFSLDGARTKVYATSLRKGILIEGTTRLFVSPADPVAFTKALTWAGAIIE